jgi:hypothetical protein
MKEDSWSIRKMRADRKLSQARNSYKQLDIEEAHDVEFSIVKKSNDGLLSQLKSYFVLFLEEN